MADDSERPSRRLADLPWLSVLGAVAIVLAGVLITMRNLPDDAANKLLDAGARSSATSFAVRQVGDVQASNGWSTSCARRTGAALRPDTLKVFHDIGFGE